MCGLQVDPCSRCENPSVIHQPYSGQRLCGRHLRASIRKRVSKDLRNQLSLPRDARGSDGTPFRILVAVSGGKDSAVMLFMLDDILGKRRDIEIVAGVVDEGIDGYRSPSIDCVTELCSNLDIELVRVGYEDIGYQRMDEVVSLMPEIADKNPEAKGMMPCSFCGVFRRQSLNALAEKTNAKVMSLGHNLDDMAQSILMNLQKGEVERSVRLAPIQTIQLRDCRQGSYHSDGFQSRKFTHSLWFWNSHSSMENAHTLWGPSAKPAETLSRH